MVTITTMTPTPTPTPISPGATADSAARDPLGPLFAWLSPGYPIGGFAYSHGLEWAIAAGDVHDRESLVAWLGDLITQGAGRSDALLMAAAWHDPTAAEPAEWAEALAASRERAQEAAWQGSAFASVTADAWGAGTAAPAPLPVAMGRAAAAAGVPLETLLPLAMQAFAANLASAAVRLVPLGQTDAQRTIAALLPLIGRVAAEAAADPDPLAAIGTATIRGDIAAMRHETQTVRLFRT
ncbi:MAG: urease accessory UreF family protein [Pseudomonadota bacterium]